MADTATEQAAPPEGPYTPAPWSPTFAQTAESIYEPDMAAAQKERAKASEREQAALKERGTAVKGAVESYREQEKQPWPAPPPVLQIGQPPTRQLHDFLAPVENEPPARTVMKMIAALTTLGTGFGGMVKGDSRAALASLTGALTGWQQGEADRADRAFKDWQAQTETAIRNADEMWKGYYAQMENRKLSLAEALNNVKLSALEHDDPVLAATAAKGDALATIAMLEKQREHLDTAITNRLRVIDAHQTAQARQAEIDRHNREVEEQKRQELVEKAREADQRAAEVAQRDRETAQYRQDMLDLRRDMAEGKKTGRAVAYTLVDQIRGLVPEMLDKGFLPKSGAAEDVAMAYMRRLRNPRDPVLTVWNMHESTMVSIGRQLGDIGPRAQAAFQGLMGVIHDHATPEGVYKAMDQLQEALDAAGGAGGGAGRATDQKTIKWSDIK